MISCNVHFYLTASYIEEIRLLTARAEVPDFHNSYNHSALAPRSKAAVVTDTVRHDAAVCMSVQLQQVSAAGAVLANAGCCTVPPSPPGGVVVSAAHRTAPATAQQQRANTWQALEKREPLLRQYVDATPQRLYTRDSLPVIQLSYSRGDGGGRETSASRGAFSGLAGGGAGCCTTSPPTTFVIMPTR